MESLTHLDGQGHAVMVDVGRKDVTQRAALAQGEIHLNEKAFRAVMDGAAPKGDVLGAARIAGIMAAKNTALLIPLCHPLMLTHCSIDFQTDPDRFVLEATATVRTDGKTGVEMEALTAVSTALLTIYDMCKALDRSMIISNIRLLHKEGGKSGTYDRQ